MGDYRPNFIVIFLLSILFVSLLVCVYFLGRFSKTTSPLAELTPSPSPTTGLINKIKWNEINKFGLVIGYPESNWLVDADGSSLSNGCQRISVTKSDAAQLELSPTDYVKKFYGPSANVSQMIADLDSKAKLSFSIIPSNNIVVIGPQGIGEINNIFVRGPTGTGYYNLAVTYIGPAVETDKKCLGRVEDDYKTILSSIYFPSTAFPTLNDKDILTEVVRDKVYNYGKDHGLSSSNQIVISVGKIEGDYASGTTSFTSDVEGSGGGWMATKIDGRWTVIAEFQEPPLCATLAKYNFPKSFSCN